LFAGGARFAALELKIGYRFVDKRLLQESLSHRSYVKTTESPSSPSFERLEFLGDSVLGLLVAEGLFRSFPDSTEGDLTKLKSALVNEQTLASIAREIRLGNHIILSNEEAKSGGRDRTSIISDSLEALIGAIYIDGGLVNAKRFVTQFVLSRTTEVQLDSSIRNFKGELLELMQGEAAGTPEYRVVDESGPDHEKKFTVAVYGFDIELAVGSGRSKKEAEQDAACSALDRVVGIVEERRLKLARQEDK
jgi:ribonuclease-3